MEIELMKYTTLWWGGGNMWRGTHLSKGVAARNWFTTIDVSSAIAFPVEEHDRVNITMLIIYKLTILVMCPVIYDCNLIGYC